MVVGLVRDALRSDYSTLALFGARRTRIKAADGVPRSWLKMGPLARETTFCDLVVRRDAPLIVEDARVRPDTRELPPVAMHGVIAYLGWPVRMGNEVHGSLSAQKLTPCEWSARDLRTLELLAGLISGELERRFGLAA